MLARRRAVRCGVAWRGVARRGGGLWPSCTRAKGADGGWTRLTASRDGWRLESVQMDQMDQMDRTIQCCQSKETGIVNPAR